LSLKLNVENDSLGLRHIKHEPIAHVVVGHKSIAELLQTRFSFDHTCFELDSLVLKNIKEVCFGKDYRLCLLDGSHLLPYSIQEPLLEDYFKALISLSSSHFVDSAHTGYGSGFYLENHLFALSQAKEKNISYQIAETCIEGGNCHLFISEQGPSAAIGVHSLVLSYIALEEQGYFEKNKELLQNMRKQIVHPSEEFLRIARNLSLFQEVVTQVDPFEQRKNYSKESIYPAFIKAIQAKYSNLTEFRRQFISSLKEEDRKKYVLSAIELETKWKITKEKISQEIKVPLDQIAFINQYHFHIDLECMILPDGWGLIHDEEQAISFLFNLPDETYENEKTIDAYLKAAKERKLHFEQHQKQTCLELERIGCKCILIPAVFEAKGEETLNFLNGLFFYLEDKTIFITNGINPRFNLYKEHFEKVLKDHQTTFEVYFIPHNMIQKVLSERFGGLSCLTWQYKS